MNRRNLLFSAGAAALAACASAPRRQFPLAADLDAAIARAMQFGLAPGLSVAVYTREGAYARGFGVTDVETGEPASADTAFYIASSTKPLTALALAKLHHRGALNLDDTLAAFAPDAAFPAVARSSEARLRPSAAASSSCASRRGSSAVRARRAAPSSISAWISVATALSRAAQAARPATPAAAAGSAPRARRP